MKGKVAWLLLPCLMVIALTMTSCGGNPALEIAEKWYAAHEDALINGNVNALDEVEDPDVVIHMPGMPDIVGLEAQKGFIAFIREVYVNLQQERLDITGSGDVAAIRWTHRWTFSKEIPGLPPPNGKEVYYPGATFLHIKDGKVVEIFGTWDTMSSAQQTGVMPAPSLPAPPSGVYNWEEAIDHAGEIWTVTGPIIDAVDLRLLGVDDIMALGMGKNLMNPSSVGIGLDVDDALLPEDLYIGKTISVTGEVSRNPLGGASIRITDLSQIQVIE